VYKREFDRWRDEQSEYKWTVEAVELAHRSTHAVIKSSTYDASDPAHVEQALEVGLAEIKASFAKELESARLEQCFRIAVVLNVLLNVPESEINSIDFETVDWERVDAKARALYNKHVLRI
jgi:hypothetical protein